MEVESKEGKSTRDVPDHESRKRKRRRNICFAVIAVVLAVALLILILALTVFKTKRPVTTVNSVALKHFDVSLDILSLSVRLNVTVDVNLSIKNPNKVGFKFTNSSAFVRYRGGVVGEVPIPAGKIGADETVPMNLTLTLWADRLLSNSNVYSDVISGTLPITTYTRISGKVSIMKFVKIHVVSYTTCDLNISVASRSIVNQTCHYKTKL